VVDDGSAAHWTADHLSSFRGHRGKSLAAIVCWFTEACPQMEPKWPWNLRSRRPCWSLGSHWWH